MCQPEKDGLISQKRKRNRTSQKGQVSGAVDFTQLAQAFLFMLISVN